MKKVKSLKKLREDFEKKSAPIITIFDNNNIDYALIGSTVLLLLFDMKIEFHDIDFLIDEKDYKKVNNLMSNHPDYGNDFLTIKKRPDRIYCSDYIGKIGDKIDFIVGYGIRVHEDEGTKILKIKLKDVNLLEANGYPVVPPKVLLQKYIAEERNQISDGKNRMRIIDEMLLKCDVTVIK